MTSTTTLRRFVSGSVHRRRASRLNAERVAQVHISLNNLRKVVVLVMDRKTPRTEIWRAAVWRGPRWNRRRGNTLSRSTRTSTRTTRTLCSGPMSYRANPRLDLQILHHRDQGHGPRSKRNDGEDASVLIDADE